MGFMHHPKPIHWEEDGYQVTRTCSWSPPGDHPLAAGMLLYVKDGKLVKVEGDPDHPVTKGALPSRLLTLPEYVYAPERVLYPMKRDPSKRGQHDAWERCTWEECYQIISDKWHQIIDEFGTAEPVIAFGGTGRQAGIWGCTWACSIFNSPHPCYMQSGWSCQGPRASEFSWIYGVPNLCMDFASQFELSYDDPRYEVPKVMLLWGKEPLKSNPDGLWGHCLVDLHKRGMKFIVADPRLTWEAARAEYWLQLRPGTDAALAMALCGVICKEDLVDHDFIDKWTFGYEQFAERCMTMTPEKAGEICGIDPEKIIGAARLFATSKPATFEMGVAVDQNPNGNQVVAALDGLLAITGQVDKPGTQCMGAIDLGGLGAGFGDLEPPELLDRMGGIDEFPALVRTIMSCSPDSILDQLETDQPYKMRMGFFNECNPIACPCNIPNRWENALKRLELNIALDIVMTPSAEAVADIFLPVCTFAEMDMYVSFMYGSCGTDLFPIVKAIEPLGDTKSDLTVMRELGATLRPHLWGKYKTDAEFINAIKLKPLGIKLEDLQEAGGWHVDYEYEKYDKGLLRPDGQKGFLTPTGRIELYSTMIETWGEDALPYYKEPPQSPVSTPEYAEEYPLVLSTGQRTWSYFHSENRHVKTLREIEPWPRVEINPIDAEKYGIADGEWIWIENHVGRAKMKASYQPGVKQGCIFAQHGWWYPEREASSPSLFGVYECNINNLVPYKTVGTLGMGAPYKCLMCKIYKAVD